MCECVRVRVHARVCVCRKGGDNLWYNHQHVNYGMLVSQLYHNVSYLFIHNQLPDCQPWQWQQCPPVLSGEETVTVAEINNKKVLVRTEIKTCNHTHFGLYL